jgi:hypothetical protein
MVFSSVSSELMRNLVRSDNGNAWINMLVYRGSPIVKRLYDTPTFSDEKLVFVSSPFFPHKLSKGYSNPALSVVKTINHKPVKNLNQLVELLRDCKEEFVAVEFDDRLSETLVFPRTQMMSATEEILTDNGVRSQGTPDTMAVWNAKPAK